MKAINVTDKFELIQDRWNPRVIAELNGQHVKIAKIEGEFVWHDHQLEDELFYILKGGLVMEFRDKKVEVNEGEMIVVPKGVEHRPVTDGEVWIMLFEPNNIRHTGDVQSDFTVGHFEKI